MSDDKGAKPPAPPTAARMAELTVAKPSKRSLAGRSRDEGGPEPLHLHYDKVLSRSAAKCLEAIEALEAEPAEEVSLMSIFIRSRELRAKRGEPGIAVSTILDNPACARLYYARRTVDPLPEPPLPKARRSDRTRSKRVLSHGLRTACAKNRELVSDIASLGAAVARRAREELDGGPGEQPD